MITVVNNRSGVESEMSQAQFDKIKDTPQWKGVFSVKDIPVSQEPPEVTKLKEEQAAAQEPEQAEEKTTTTKTTKRAGSQQNETTK